MAKSKKKILNLFSSNWIITLTATLVGVFLALYLNEWRSSNKLDNQKRIATENILKEIKSNQQQLEQSVVLNKSLLGVLEFTEEYMDEENRIIVSPDSVNIFRKKYPGLFTVTDSTLVGEGKYHYEGEMNMNLGFSYIGLSTLAWETMVNSGISSAYDFNCLMYLNTLEKITRKVVELDENVLSLLFKLKGEAPSDDQLKRSVILLIEYEESLLQMYEDKEKGFTNCIG